jgi:rhodanese-related sulfurtransferase
MNTITAPELRAKYEDNEEFLVVDVREPSSYLQARLPRAIDVPLGTIRDTAGQHLPRKTMEVVVYGDTPEMCRRAGQILDELGYRHVTLFTELELWQRSGYEMEEA